MASNQGIQGVDVRETGGTLVFRAAFTNTAGTVQSTGTTYLTIYELESDGTLKSFDFSGSTFSTAALNTGSVTMTQQNGNNGTTATGLWTYALNTLTHFSTNSIYISQATNTLGSNQVQSREFQYGGAQGDLTVTQGATGVAYLKTDSEYWGGNTLASVGVAGMPDVNLVDIAASAVSTTTAQLGVNVVKYNNHTAATDANNLPQVDVEDWGGHTLASVATAGIPDVNLKNIANSAVATGSAQLGVNIVNIAGTASAGAAGYVGVDWAHVDNPSTSVNLSNTTVQLVNTVTTSTTITNPVTLAAIQTLTNIVINNGTITLGDAQINSGNLSLSYINSTSGSVGVDWNRIANPSSSVNLSGTNISQVNGSVESVTGNVNGSVNDVATPVAIDWSLVANTGAANNLSNTTIKVVTSASLAQTQPAQVTFPLIQVNTLDVTNANVTTFNVTNGTQTLFINNTNSSGGANVNVTSWLGTAVQVQSGLPLVTGGGTGSGAYAVTVNVTDTSSNPINGAFVSMTLGGVVSGSGFTNSSGVIVLDLDNHTYVLTITCPNYIGLTPTNEVISGITTINKSLTPIVIPSPPGANQSTGYLYARDAYGNLITDGSATFWFYMLSPTGVAGVSDQQQALSISSAVTTGLVTSPFEISQKYSMVRQSSTPSLSQFLTTSATFTVTNTSPFTLPYIWGPD